MDDKIKEFTPKPIVEGINPYNRLEDETDLMHAMMDLFIDVEKGELEHVEASVKATEIVKAYIKNLK